MAGYSQGRNTGACRNEWLVIGGLNTAQKGLTSKQKSDRRVTPNPGNFGHKKHKNDFIPNRKFPRAHRRLESCIRRRVLVFFVAKMVRHFAGFAASSQINN
ncbi:MAG TPA: hypothetical protein VKC51_04535 [Lacunisphaera sp.]|nr:hypothetical protein [Lacunisphaera sp.]